MARDQFAENEEDGREVEDDDEEYRELSSSSSSGGEDEEIERDNDERSRLPPTTSFTPSSSSEHASDADADDRTETNSRRLHARGSKTKRHAERDKKRGDVLDSLLACFGLRGISDNRAFCKMDMAKCNTVDNLKRILHDLEDAYYTPCTARVYLRDISDRRAITILKQVLRKHHYTLLSRERNINGHKVIFYQVTREADVNNLHHMKKHGDDVVWVTFDA